MAIQLERPNAFPLQRPSRVRVGFALGADDRAADRGPLEFLEAAMAIAARGFILGIGLGTVMVVGGRAPLAELTALGIVAIGAALLSWGQ
jgi:hypothetical protein